MRSIRRAALAGATAASLVLGAASVATADEANDSDKGLSSSVKSMSSEDKDNDSMKGEKDQEGESKDGSSLRTSSTRIGDKLDADEPANGRALWGSDTDDSNQPKWARYMKIVTIVSLVGSFLGLVVFPAYNFAVANNLIVK